MQRVNRSSRPQNPTWALPCAATAASWGSAAIPAQRSRAGQAGIHVFPRPKRCPWGVASHRTPRGTLNRQSLRQETEGLLPCVEHRACGHLAQCLSQSQHQGRLYRRIKCRGSLHFVRSEESRRSIGPPPACGCGDRLEQAYDSPLDREFGEQQSPRPVGGQMVPHPEGDRGRLGLNVGRGGLDDRSRLDR